MRTRHLLISACVLLFSCAKETDSPVQPEQQTPQVKTYTLTVAAGKGDRPDTKALNINGNTLEALWAVGEEVSVYKGEALIGTLSAKEAGSNTTLSGSITGDLSAGDQLTLKFLSPDYASQDGSIEYISAHCDYAVANVTVTNVEGTSVTTTSAQFENQQAIVKFNLNVSARPLIVTLPKQTITVTPSSARDWLIVAVPAVSSASVFLKATAGEKTYMLNKTGVTLEAGKYYNIGVTLSDAIEVHNEAELTAAVTNDNAYILFANDISTTSLLEIKESRTITIDMNGFTLNRGCTSRDSQAIVVRTGSTLNLSNGTVTGGWGGHGGAFDIESGTHVTLIDVIITGNHADDRGGGISIREGGTLNMTGGAITDNFSKDNSGTPAGGGGLFIYGGSTAMLTGVTISGNETEVYGGGGIDNFGTLTLNGCTITGNTSKANGAGIWTSSGSTLNMQGEITVADNAASESVASNLFLSGGTVITVTGSLAGSSIGVNMENATGTFTSGYSTYNSGEVYAYGADEGAGIGGGENGDGAEVTITGGIVEAHAGENKLNYKAIGPGRDSDNYGTLNLGDQMMVRYKIENNWSEPVPVDYEYGGRKAGAWYHTEARIEPCTHPGYTAETCPYHKH